MSVTDLPETGRHSPKMSGKHRSSPKRTSHMQEGRLKDVRKTQVKSETDMSYFGKKREIRQEDGHL